MSETEQYRQECVAELAKRGITSDQWKCSVTGESIDPIRVLILLDDGVPLADLTSKSVAAHMVKPKRAAFEGEDGDFRVVTSVENDSSVQAVTDKDDAEEEEESPADAKRVKSDAPRPISAPTPAFHVEEIVEELPAT